MILYSPVLPAIENLHSHMLVLRTYVERIVFGFLVLDWAVLYMMSARIHGEGDVLLVTRLVQRCSFIIDLSLVERGLEVIYFVWISGGIELSWYLRFYCQPWDECLVVCRAGGNNDCARYHDWDLQSQVVECVQRRVEINNAGSAEQHADFLDKPLCAFFFGT